MKKLLGLMLSSFVSFAHRRLRSTIDDHDHDRFQPERHTHHDNDDHHHVADRDHSSTRSTIRPTSPSTSRSTSPPAVN
ncbi:MAG: hypothetical protein MZU97_26495 [Bacillus subtilis]|nr:hypothetical protein [Bacillus subtilis]